MWLFKSLGFNLQDFRGLRAKTRDSELIPNKPRVSLTKLPREGVSGFLGHWSEINGWEQIYGWARARTDQQARVISDRGGEADWPVGPGARGIGGRHVGPDAARARSGIPWSRSCDPNRTVEINTRRADGCGRRRSCSQWWGRRSWGGCGLRRFRGRRGWPETKRKTRRTHWWGCDHETGGQRGENGGGKAPGGSGQLRRAIAAEERGIWGVLGPRLTSAGWGEHQGPTQGHWTGLIQPVTARARRTAAVELWRSRFWPMTKHNWGNRARERVSHLGAKLGVAWRGFWRARWPAVRTKICIRK
jgi:hypothetical protein